MSPDSGFEWQMANGKWQMPLDFNLRVLIFDWGSWE
jgi:hypothetical protein